MGYRLHGQVSLPKARTNPNFKCQAIDYRGKEVVRHSSHNPGYRRRMAQPICGVSCGSTWDRGGSRPSANVQSAIQFHLETLGAKTVDPADPVLNIIVRDAQV